MENQNLNQQPVEPQPQQQVPIQPEQPVVMSQQPKTNWPVLISILVLAVVSYAGVAYWQDVWPFGEDVIVGESPTPSITPKSTLSETVDWKTYSNEKWNFAIQYPTSFYIEESEKENALTLRISDKPFIAVQEAGASPKYLWIDAGLLSGRHPCASYGRTPTQEFTIGDKAASDTTRCLDEGSYFGQGVGLFAEAWYIDTQYTFSADFYDQHKEVVNIILESFAHPY